MYCPSIELLISDTIFFTSIISTWFLFHRFMFSDEILYISLILLSIFFRKSFLSMYLITLVPGCKVCFSLCFLSWLWVFWLCFLSFLVIFMKCQKFWMIVFFFREVLFSLTGRFILIQSGVDDSGLWSLHESLGRIGRNQQLTEEQKWGDWNKVGG